MGEQWHRLRYAAAAFRAAWRDMGAALTRTESANERFKRRGGLRLGVALPLAVLAHGLAFALLPGPRPASFAGEDASPLRVIEVPPEVTVPRPPDEIVRPAVPVIAEIDVPADVTIPVVSFAEAGPAVAPTPPPPTRTVAELLPGYEHLTRFVVAPELKNRDRVLRVLDASYPPRLFAAGIGGRVLIWCWIDESGEVRQFQIKRSSGYDELDAVAARLVEIMEFRPAVNRGEPVRVIVALPIVFEGSGVRAAGLSGT